MDKKNTTIGVLLLLLAFGALYFSPKSAPPTKPENAQTATTPEGASATASNAPAASATTPAGTPVVAGQATTPATPAAAPTTLYAPVAKEPANAATTTLANDFVEIRFTEFGGAVRDVAFRKYPAVQGKPEPYVFNGLHEDPILALGNETGLGRSTRYTLVSSTPNEVVYRVVLDGKVEVTRTYRLTDPAKGGDPYRLQHETTFKNLGNTPAVLPQATLALGTASLLNDHDIGTYLTGVSFDGSDTIFIERSEFDGARFFGSREPKPVVSKPGNLIWVGVKNQFFASLYTPDTPSVGLLGRRLDLTKEAPFANPNQVNVAVAAAAKFDLPPLAPNATAKLSGRLYVGPQERERLAKFDHDESRVLPYTQYFFNRIFFSRYVAPGLNFLMNQLYKLVGNWGVAVILMTLTLKIVSLPFTLAASRSAKRMAKIQPELQAIREKYKDNPQKQQQATLEVFKTHKVNPVGGCIPVLITMPLFIGFFAMLQSVPELRFQHFLWAPDLSAPDTIARPFGVPLNIMPLLMGATMFFQMRLTPTPSVDNMQVKMMQFMPIVFTFICYNFSCALSLYSTINGLFTIGQQMVINKMKDPGDAGPAGPGTAAATTASALGKGMKNVTPKKK